MAEETNKYLREEVKRLTDENRDLRDGMRAMYESVRALAALYRVSQNIDADTDVLRLLGDILDTSLAVLKASDGSLMLQDEGTGELVFTVVRSKVADQLIGYRLPKGAGIAGWVVEHCEPQVILNVQHDTRFYPQVDEAFGSVTRSMVCVPIYLDNGRVLGVIEILNKLSDREFTQDDLNLMLIVAQLAATAMRRAERATEEVERTERRAALLQLAKPRG
jgi:sigma-B regulation protein RsbU (phosphoserine phosphatase)